LKEFASHIHLVKLKRDITFANNLLREESKLPTWLEQFFSFKATAAKKWI